MTIRVTEGGGGDQPHEAGERARPNVGGRCAWCARPLQAPVGPGRPRRYCRQGCRQRAYEARLRSAELDLAVDDVVVGRAQLDELASALYCLQTALEDVDRDLAAAGDDPAEIRLALDWLLDNARPLASLWIEPRAAGGDAGA